jgi:hypothetical protein
LSSNVVEVPASLETGLVVEVPRMASTKSHD